MATNANQNQNPRYVRDSGYGETDTKCSVHVDQPAVVYLKKDDGTMVPLGNQARGELIESEQALAKIDNRVPRFLTLIPIWCLNAASDVANGFLGLNAGLWGSDDNGRKFKLCCVPGCNHPAGNRSVPKKGINYVPCAACANAFAVVAAKANRSDLVPMDAEAGRRRAEEYRAAIEAKNMKTSALAASLLGPAKVVDGKLVQNPFAAAIAMPALNSTPAPSRQCRPKGKKARKATATKATGNPTKADEPIAIAAPTPPAEESPRETAAVVN